MKTKIIGILVCILLIATVIPVVGTFNNSYQSKDPVNTLLNDGWIKTYGGTELDFFNCVKQTNDNGFIITGKTASYGAGNWDAWLMKTDEDGNEIWNTTFGGKDLEGGPEGLQQTSDGGYIIATVTNSFGAGDFDIWIIKTDEDGNEIWNKTFGGPEIDWSANIFQTDDGGYIHAGNTMLYGKGMSDIWLIKIDNEGNEIWNKTYGSAGFDYCFGMDATDDGGYIICGEKDSPNGGAWLLKIDAEGNLQWEKNYKYRNKGNCYAFTVKQTGDGGYIFGGDTNFYFLGNIWLGRSDIWIVKTDVNGNKLWEKTYGRFIFEDTFFHISQTNDGGFLISGLTNGLGGLLFQMQGQPPYKLASLIKIDENGNVEWKETYGQGWCLWSEPTNDGGAIAVAGIKQPERSMDALLIKL